MEIKITKSGISFGSLVKLFSIGYFIGMGILLTLMLGIFAYPKWHQSMPVYLWLIVPALIAIQSFLTAVIVAAAIKLYGKLNKFEITSYEEKL